MSSKVSVVGSRPVSRSWSIYDFILIWVGGLVGTGIFLALGVLIGRDEWVTILSLAGQYVGSLGVFWILTRSKDVRELRLTLKRGDLGYVALGLVLQVAVALMSLPLINLLFPDGRPQQQVADVIANADTLFAQVALVTAAVVVGPVTEEIMYRGVLLKGLEVRGRTFALVVSSLVFALVHVSGLDMDRLVASAAVFLPPLFLLGLVLAWITLRTGRLGPAIFLHSGWNLLSAFVLLLPVDVLEQVN